MLNSPNEAALGRPQTASDEDLRQFSANLTSARRHRRSLAVTIRQSLAGPLSLPIALFRATQGIWQYGNAVKKQHRVSLAKQFYYLSSDHFFYKTFPDSFYMNQLYAPKNHERRNRVFGFGLVLPLQQYLIDLGGYQDYPALRSKALFATRCLEAGLPTIPIVAEFTGGKMISRGPSGETTLPPVDLFTKPSNYYCGIGANSWRYEPTDRYRNSLSGDTFDSTALIGKLCADSRAGEIVLQEKMSNHLSMIGTVTKGGLSTIRIVTCESPSRDIEFLPPVLRMPLGDSIVDNLAQGGLAAPIDISSGRLSGSAIRKDKKLGIATYEKHPETGAKLNGIQMPCWQQVLDLARSAHRAFASMPFVGWDVAILESGPVVVEGNPWWDVDLTVLPHGLTLSDTQFIPYYNYHLQKAASRTNAA